MSIMDVTEKCSACGMEYPIDQLFRWVEDGAPHFVCLNSRQCRERGSIVKSGADPLVMAGRIRGLLDIARQWPSNVGYKQTFTRELERIELQLRLIDSNDRETRRLVNDLADSVSRLEDRVLRLEQELAQTRTRIGLPG